MVTGSIALAAAAMFAGAAFYINFAEHPARMYLPVDRAVQQWRPSYKRGFAMQSILAIAGGVFAILTWYRGGGGAWLAGGLLLLANWPYTLMVIMPTNRQLSLPGAGEDPASAELLRRWNRLHAVRTALGMVAVAAMIIGTLDWQ